MPRQSGFTEAELAAAAWRRNLNNNGAIKDSTEWAQKRAERRAARKAARKAERKESASGGGRSGSGSKRRGESRRSRKSSRRPRRKEPGRTARDRSVSMGSVDSLGRERPKRRRSRSPGGGGSDSDSRRRRRKTRGGRRGERRARAGGGDDDDDDDEDDAMSHLEKALGWRGAMARMSKSPSVASGGSGSDSSSRGRGRGGEGSGRGRRGWSSASSSGGESVSSSRSFGGESDSEPRAPPNEEAAPRIGILGTLGSVDDVPADPRRPEHDDRDARWRGGRGGGWHQAPGVSMGVMARGRGGREGSASELASGSSSRGTCSSGRRRGYSRGEFYRESGRVRRSVSTDRRTKARSPSPGGREIARSLSRSLSRDRRSRRGSRSRSPSSRRSRSRDRAVSGLLQEIMRKGSSDDGRGRDGAAKTWTHDLYEEIAGAESPPRPRPPPGYRPQPESWVSRAGGVYVPLKPS